MEKVEQFIQEHTKETSSPIIDWDGNIAIYQPWLTPDEARKIAEIAMEETIKEVCEWTKCNVGKYSWYDPIEDNEGFNVSGLIDDLKKYLEDKA